jgi:AcrR family transcriptional regulator
MPSVPETPNRDRKARETRARIADTALDLFVRQGYADTTIDQIATAAGVGRRTVFRYFATKHDILFDHLAVRREEAIQSLKERPAGEPPLVSLHAVLRQHCHRGYDRRLLEQIWAVIATQPQLAGQTRVAAGSDEFERKLAATLQQRLGDDMPRLEVWALTQMACGWFRTATIVFFVEGRSSLLSCFDEVVATCTRHTSLGLG